MGFNPEPTYTFSQFLFRDFQRASSVVIVPTSAVRIVPKHVDIYFPVITHGGDILHVFSVIPDVGGIVVPIWWNMPAATQTIPAYCSEGISIMINEEDYSAMHHVQTIHRLSSLFNSITTFSADKLIRKRQVVLPKLDIYKALRLQQQQQQQRDPATPLSKKRVYIYKPLYGCLNAEDFKKRLYYALANYLYKDWNCIEGDGRNVLMWLWERGHFYSVNFFDANVIVAIYDDCWTPADLDVFVSQVRRGFTDREFFFQVDKSGGQKHFSYKHNTFTRVFIIASTTTIIPQSLYELTAFEPNVLLMPQATVGDILDF